MFLLHSFTVRLRPECGCCWLQIPAWLYAGLSDPLSQTELVVCHKLDLLLKMWAFVCLIGWLLVQRLKKEVTSSQAKCDAAHSKRTKNESKYLEWQICCGWFLVSVSHGKVYLHVSFGLLLLLLHWGSQLVISLNGCFENLWPYSFQEVLENRLIPFFCHIVSTS